MAHLGSFIGLGYSLFDPFPRVCRSGSSGAHLLLAESRMNHLVAPLLLSVSLTLTFTSAFANTSPHCS